MSASIAVSSCGRIIQEISAAVEGGELAPGEPLPSTINLARQFAVSVGTVRNALDILKDRGVLEGRQGRGVYVAGGQRHAHADESPRMASIYVIAFSSGTVKVGISLTPLTRISNLAGAARSHGTKVVRTWHSPPHLNAPANEDALKAFGRSHYPIASGTEFFKDADFDELVEHATTLLAAQNVAPVVGNQPSLFDPEPAPARRKPAMATTAPIRRFT